ncbi:MAG: hypothetical protein MJE77_18455 [Proteobacteria bacterium]|nr:hypothetical protein [Pseudomonadota bacterium]
MARFSRCGVMRLIQFTAMACGLCWHGAEGWSQSEPTRRCDPAEIEVPADDKPGAAGMATIDCGRGALYVAELFRAGHMVDAHLVAQTLDALCAGGVIPPSWRLWGAIALIDLDESYRARRILASLSSSRDLSLRRSAAVIGVWSLLKDGDEQAFERALPALDEPARARLLVLRAIYDHGKGGSREFESISSRLDAQLRAAVTGVYTTHRAQRTKEPWLAATMSAVLPGLGQLYAGSVESAAAALVLNGVLIGATVELARHDLYFASTTTGLVASMFYVGSILNAADLAHRYNDRASDATRRELETLLLPELVPR